MKHLLNLFDSIVSSVFRYAFGVWGPVAGKLNKFDQLFTQYITWIFRLPRSSCQTAILACFGRRCAVCDSLFLASVQLARGFVNTDEIWGSVACALKDQTLKGSKWYKEVVAELVKRELKSKVWDSPQVVLAERKEFGVSFSQYCFHQHLNLARGTSADEIRKLQPFGIYPFLLKTPPARSRFLFSFILSNWRWLNGSQCSSYPSICSDCGVTNSSVHLLFECTLFERERVNFVRAVGVPFEFSCLTKDDAQMARAVVDLGIAIYEKVRSLCVRST
jgi:hypothetical protein